MKLRQCVDEYVAYRRSLGAVFRGEAVRLKGFVRSVGDIPMRQITTDQVLVYLKGKGPTTNFWLCKYYTLTGLYRFAVSRRYVSASPLPKTKPRRQRNFVPYHFTEADMIALLLASEERHTRSRLLLPITVRSLLLLLYATGLRISEALALNAGDVDLPTRILTIRETKFHKSRLVPFGHDLCDVLTRYYEDRRSTDVPAGSITDESSFLADRFGRRILRQTAEMTFKANREHAGLQRRPKSKFYPRLHDLRHTFAINRLTSWYREGKNVQSLLPHLATYLGHHSIQDTRRYLEFTHDIAAEASARFHRYACPADRTRHDGQDTN